MNKEEITRKARKILIKNRHRKKNPLSSFAFRTSMILTMVLVVVVTLLSLSFLNIIQIAITDNENRELKTHNGVLRGSFETGHEIFFIPYYISYIIYDVETKEILKTNNPFLPLLGETKKEAKRYIKKNYFSDGDLNIMYYAKPIEHNGKTYMVITAENMDYNIRDKIIEDAPFAATIIILPILIASFLLTFLISRHTIKPVIRVTKKAKSISSSNLDEKLPTGKFNDEIDDLSNTFNALFKRLKQDFDREKQFSSDVSHELKTPLAVIIGQTNLLLRWGKDDSDQLEKSLKSIKEEAKSMEVTINNLLQITRIESGRIKPQNQNFQISELFERLQNEFQQIAPKTTIIIDDPEKVSVDTDLEMLHQILTVCMSNSLKFAGEECEMKLRAKYDEDKIIITAEDDGAGFDKKSMNKVFDRFFCGDESRNRSKGGCGLGLSIAKVLVTAMGGEISAENAKPHGAVIKIVLH